MKTNYANEAEAISAAISTAKRQVSAQVVVQNALRGGYGYLDATEYAFDATRDFILKYDPVAFVYTDGRVETLARNIAKV